MGSGSGSGKETASVAGPPPALVPLLCGRVESLGGRVVLCVESLKLFGPTGADKPSV